MLRVTITVGGTPIGEAKTWAYPNGEKLGLFLTPTYNLTVTGMNAKRQIVREQFSVLRFGVQCKDFKTATVVRLANAQTHIIKAWIPTYIVHSAPSTEEGAWQVYDNFLIHDGPDNDTEVFATIGCIEIMGPQGFNKFNDLIISLAGPAAASRDQQLAQIGRSGLLSITYEQAVRPALKKGR